ncbi:DAPB [Candida pseudojiufengensis]|uniref:DAPB n=1 Tax=Candida pseudojiufengensis TaxID=497109 RepID=UPI0022253C0C|nr:DAPB [Candida pseudojiufengensis]KAI5966858.1 DAPB [Candida pseudojiufengensis]
MTDTYEYIDSKEPLTKYPQKSKRIKLLKRLLSIGVILSILIWGSSFLFITVDNFLIKYGNYEVNHQFLSQSISSKPSSIYVSPNDKFTNFGDKIPLNKKIYDDHELNPKIHDIQWIKEPSSIYNDQGTYVIKEDISSKDDFKVVIKSIANEKYEHTLIETSKFTYDDKEYLIEKFKASPDLKKVLLQTDITSSWRYSSLSLYWILDVEKKEIEPLFNGNTKISTVSWSPDSLNVAFIYNNNIYLKSLKDNKLTQVTFDGSNEIFNGKPDWVYEEEVFGNDLVLWWSPSGDKFAFLKSNNTEVPEFIIPFYAQNEFKDYPEIVKIKYPKAGYPNPLVEVLSYDLAKDKLIKHDLKSEHIEINNRIISEVAWVGEEILVKTSNRASDHLKIFLINEKNSNLIRTHKSKNEWFDRTTIFYIPKNKTAGRENDGYIDIILENGFNHLAYFSPPENPEYRLLTKGNWEIVGGVDSFDYNSNTVFFTSTIKSSIERHLHSINLFDQTNNGLPYIKDLTAKEGYYSSSFSSGGRFLFLSDLGPNVPTQRINDLKLGKNVKTIEDNFEFSKKLRKYILPEIKYGEIELTDDETGEKFKVNTQEIFPLNFDKNKKYPVLFFIYGGPGSQQVTKKWSISFSLLVAAELNAVVVTFDGRGTGFNNLNYKLGSKFKYIVKNKIGKYEAKDVISAGRYWSKKSYVDPDRIAVWGWSYGGFLTLKTLESDYQDSVFNYGVAIAPVTKWRLYDSIYTERYLNTPQANPEGYQIGSINNITNFKSVKKFFIGHGSGDDNVHLQHSLQLIDEFNLKEVENFEFMIFPDSNHGMNYHNGNKIVFDRILNFLKRAFNWEFV